MNENTNECKIGGDFYIYMHMSSKRNKKKEKQLDDEAQ